MVPVNTNPVVNASLENKKINITGFNPVEPVFKCLFDEPDGSTYWYDTYWYINTDTVKVVESKPYQNNQSWLYPKDWVDKYDLNMVVRYMFLHYTDLKYSYAWISWMQGLMWVLLYKWNELCKYFTFINYSLLQNAFHIHSKTVGGIPNFLEFLKIIYL